MKNVEVTVERGGRPAVAGMICRRFGSDVRVVHDPDGAPQLVGSDMAISISHSRRFAAIALHQWMRPGVDIEEPRLAQLGRVASRFLSERERRLWADDLLAAWTIKEAVFKAAGDASVALGLINISTPDVARLPDGRCFDLETRREADYTLTVAVERLPAEKEIALLDRLIGRQPENAAAIYRRGSLHVKLEHHGAALTDFNTAAALDPDGPAAAAAEGLRNILAFHLPLNP